MAILERKRDQASVDDVEWFKMRLILRVLFLGKSLRPGTINLIAFHLKASPDHDASYECSRKCKLVSCEGQIDKVFCH